MEINIYHDIITLYMNEEKDSAINHVNELLSDEMKESLAGALNTLQTLYDEEINVEGATIQKAMEYIPLFVIEGLLMAANLGITQEELYLITDWYAQQYRLYKEE